MKKTAGKSKGKASKPAKKKRSPKAQKPLDLVEVRKEITNIVGAEATDLAQAVVAEGLKGQLAPVKYLFEMTGLYPTPEGNQPGPEEASLAKTLLHRLGMPTDMVIKRDDDEVPLKLNSSSDNSGDKGAKESENADSPDCKKSPADRKDADKDGDVAVLAESIP